MLPQRLRNRIPERHRIEGREVIKGWWGWLEGALITCIPLFFPHHFMVYTLGQQPRNIALIINAKLPRQTSANGLLNSATKMRCFGKREKIYRIEGAFHGRPPMCGENDRRGCGKVDGKLPRNFRQSRGGSNPAYKIAFDDSEFAMSVGETRMP